MSLPPVSHGFFVGTNDVAELPIILAARCRLSSLVGAVSVAKLSFNFTIREALGFVTLSPPAEWILRLCLAAATLGMLIELQVINWAWSSGMRCALAHAGAMVFLKTATVTPRYAWRDLSPVTAIRIFCLADGCVWIHCIWSGLFSVHLSQASEFSVMGNLWPLAWPFAFASCGAGYPRNIPPSQYAIGTSSHLLSLEKEGLVLYTLVALNH